jgi:hypothetical protein
MSDRDRCASEQTALTETDIIEMGAHSLPLECLLSPGLESALPVPGLSLATLVRPMRKNRVRYGR